MYPVSIQYTDYFSSPGRAIGPLRVCAQIITFEVHDLSPGYFACWFQMTLFRSSLKEKV